MKQITQPKIGPIGHSAGDDIEGLAFQLAYELRRLSAREKDARTREVVGAALAAYEHAGDDEDELKRFVEETGREALEAYCLPYMYFGAAPTGEYGFWPDFEALNEAVHCNDGVVKVDAGDPWPPLWTPAGREIQFVMEVNDHGNVSLYKRSKAEVWSCV